MNQDTAFSIRQHRSEALMNAFDNHGMGLDCAGRCGQEAVVPVASRTPLAMALTVSGGTSPRTVI